MLIGGGSAALTGTLKSMPRWRRFSEGRPELEVEISVFVQLKG
jgi:hypothetical protein